MKSRVNYNMDLTLMLTEKDVYGCFVDSVGDLKIYSIPRGLYVNVFIYNDLVNCGNGLYLKMKTRSGKDNFRKCGTGILPLIGIFETDPELPYYSRVLFESLLI